MAARAIARKEQVDTQGNCCDRGGLFKQEGCGEKDAGYREFRPHSRRTSAKRDRPCPDDWEIHDHLAVERKVFPIPPGLENTVKERSNQTGVAIKQVAADHEKARHRA